MKPCLADVNVLLALLQADHLHHLQARQWFGGLVAGEARVCRLSQLSLLRLLTNRAVMKRDVLSNQAAMNVVDRLLQDERIEFAHEPEDVGQRFAAYVSLGIPATQVISDAYLAAFARTMDWALVTFDRGMRNFSQLRVILLG